MPSHCRGCRQLTHRKSAFCLACERRGRSEGHEPGDLTSDQIDRLLARLDAKARRDRWRDPTLS